MPNYTLTTKDLERLHHPFAWPFIRAAKSFFGYGSQYSWGGYQGSSIRYAGTNFDYKSNAGELDQSSIIMACIHFIMRAWPEARPRVMLQSEGNDQEKFDHPLTALLSDPNPYYDGLLLQQATTASYNLCGNAFWLKGRNPLGKVIRLWYEPHHLIRPMWPEAGSPILDTEEGFITHYEIYRNFKWIRVEKHNVVHFRFGIDPKNPRMGLSPLLSALREVYTDNEAANYTATLLKNMGIIGMIISPKGDGMFDDPERLKLDIMARTQGDRRGEPTVIDAAADVIIPQTSTATMSTRELRWIPEERICALLGLPASVVGMGAGLQHSAEANVGNNREQAYESNLIPTQMLFAAALTRQLLPDFSTNKREYVDYDRSNIRVLQEDNMKVAISTAKLYEAGIISLAQAKTRVGETAEPGDELIYKNNPAPLALPSPNGNGNGKLNADELEIVAAG